MTILSLLKLSPEQQAAVLSDGPATAVTAGAGSGKTRTLAGRYLWLLEQGRPVRSLVAVTFTEKAAREMRNRIRGFINDWRNQPAVGEEKTLWDQAYLELDAARISTIHGLCAAILRAHPAEAGVDPLFEVLEENTALLLQSRAVDQALGWAIEDRVCAQLFGPLKEYGLRSTLSNLLTQRLDAKPAFLALGDDALKHWSAAAARWFGDRLQDAAWRSALADLAALSARDPGDKMEQARRVALAHWQQVETGQRAGDWEQVAMGLALMRKANSSHGNKGNWGGDDLQIARDAMKCLRSYHDEHLKPLLGATPPSWTLDEQAAALQPGLQRLFGHCRRLYDEAKRERQALDFDDLESMTAALLAEHPDVRVRWQNDTAAVLVDEFQDTNARQRAIIDQITGFPAENAVTDASNTHPASSLFIVGDGKQSIYRFRGADVTVFRQAQADILAAQGQTLSLDTTYRAHRPLVQILNRLLAPIMGEEADPQRPYLTPFAPLRAHRPDPKAHIHAPFLEFHLGLGNAAEGRPAAAAGLAAHLQQQHEMGVKWGDVALLFRASSAFGVYEDALEAAGVPFVTVAGRGFYERPEVRDLLNALAAVSDPTDDLAMAGLLRSPMFGLSDAALFLLRRGLEAHQGKLSFRAALADESVLAILEDVDARQARRATEIVTELHDMAGRRTVAYVLKRLLDRTRYQAALRLASGGERAWRNVDKLLADAHRSRLVGVSDFLDYVRNLRDVAVREGEAPVEAADAVQLMTIHKAKGLEFPVVVLAAAAYNRPNKAPPLLLDATLGPLLRIGDDEDRGAVPLIYRLGRLHRQDMEAAESRRLLYVAATRAQEKLLISGYGRVSTAKRNAGSLILSGWLKTLGEVVGLGDIRLHEIPAAPVTETLPWADAGVSVTLYPPSDSSPPPVARPIQPAGQRPAPDHPPASDLIPALALSPHPDQPDTKTADKEADPPPRVWRVASPSARPPNWVVGTLVHVALQHWRFPDQPDFDAFLRPFALEKGLISEKALRNALSESAQLLRRFQAHDLYAALDQAERHHEVPFSVESAGKIDSGVIDLVARSAPGAPWALYDFKTDELPAGSDLQAHIAKKKYNEQIERYAAALERLLGRRPQTRFVFLNVGGAVEMVTP